MKQNKKSVNNIIGFTCGSFDLLHAGHALMLKECKNYCDTLIVGLQKDPSADRNYKNKPVQTLEERRIMLESIKYIDKIYAYSTEKDLYSLLQLLTPDVRIVGSDWKDKKFETIVCDVSSISDEVAKISPWFSSVECQTGIGGDKLINEVFKNVAAHAEKNCKFYFPVISLSDVETIKANSKKYFKNIKIVKKKNWPLPEEMLPKIDFLRKLKEEKKVDFKERFGIVICYTEVYEATIE